MLFTDLQSRLVFHYFSYTSQDHQTKVSTIFQWAGLSHSNHQLRKPAIDLPTVAKCDRSTRESVLFGTNLSMFLFALVVVCVCLVLEGLGLVRTFGWKIH